MEKQSSSFAFRFEIYFKMSDLQTFRILFLFTETTKNYHFFQDFFLNVNFLFWLVLTFLPNTLIKI